MYERIFEQTERLFKPWSEIWSLQAEAAEILAKKQTSMMTDVWNQGVSALQNIPNQKSMEDVFKLQQEYWENLNGCVQEMVEDTQGILMETNQKISAVLHKSVPAPVSDAMERAAKSAPAKMMADSVKKAAPAVKKATAAPTKAAAASAKTAAKTAGAPPVKAATSVAAAIQNKASEAAKPAAAVVKPSETKNESKSDTAKSGESAGSKPDSVSR